MERVRELIDKLWKQHQQQEAPGQLLDTVQHLQEALLRLVHKDPATGAGKVAVVLPPKRRIPTVSVAPTAMPQPAAEKPQEIPAPTETPLPAPIATSQPGVAPIPEADLPYLPAPAGVVPAAASEDGAPAAKTPYSLPKPQVAEPLPSAPAPEPAPAQPSPIPAEPERELFHLHFDTTDEAPTLTQQYAQQPRELHELIGEQKESLNDRLKQNQPELGNKLKDTPVKDLRKAIGVNDKFLFIKELFRGDEAMYERSIKTINNFHILPEAEYWISRELKVKLGWDDRSDAAQVFYQLVRRRFL